MQQARRRTERSTMRRVDGAGTSGDQPNDLLVEEPMLIRLDGAVVATTMRTPGNDFELAVGFCHAEGLLGEAAPAEVLDGASGSGADASNTVSLSGGVSGASDRARIGAISSSCGWCGADSIEPLVERLPLVAGLPVPSMGVLAAVESSVRTRQELFASTGAAHAAAVFDPATGAVEIVREDIGRHNAVDKVVGRLRLDGRLPASGQGLWVSGRASFEIVQKAWAAGFGVLVSVSAPSALAVETARRAGITLVGLSRSDGAIIYHQPD